MWIIARNCCEERNGFLDRALIVGTYKEPQMVFGKKCYRIMGNEKFMKEESLQLYYEKYLKYKTGI